MAVMKEAQQVSPDIKDAMMLRQKSIIDRLDYQRAMKRLSKVNMSQRELAQVLRVSQPTLNKSLSRAAGVPEPRRGFSGASPYEIAQRYAAEELSREEVIDELSRWEYAPDAGPTDGYDSLLVDSPGSLDEVVQAFDDGLLEDEVYTTIIRNVAAAGN